MRKFNLREVLLLSITAALLLVWLDVSSAIARNSQSPDQVLSSTEEGQLSLTQGKFSTSTSTPSPEATNVLSLPIVQQDASLQTSIPEASEEPTPSPTITPTPPPPQPIEENAPIVFGAIVIVLIIILAWLFIGRQRFNQGN